MMLISKTIRQKLTVLAVGSSLFAGCSSGPQLSSIRFWPGAQKMESAADDEAVAQKWRERLNQSALSNGYGTAPGFETAQLDDNAAKSRSNRFNIFRRFSRKKEAEAPQTPETAVTDLNAERQRLALERRIAELEAEQRALQQQETAAYPSRPGSFDPRGASETSDPFMAAASQNPPEQKKVIVRPAIRPAPRQPETAAADAGLPSWAQPGGQNVAATPAPPARDVAGNPPTNTFSPGFDRNLNNLASAAGSPAAAAPPIGKAPAMPFDVQPTVTPRTANPFAQQQQQTAATAQQTPQQPQPRMDRPVAESSKRDHLASLRTAEEQQRIWAQLEVNNLLKHSRALARNGQLDEALTTALAAEQLANSADVQFYDGVQTPAQLVSLIRLKAEETQSAPLHQQSGPQQAIAGATPHANLNAPQHTPPQDASQYVSTKTVAPPQWPARTNGMDPQQVTADHPLVATPGTPKGSASGRSLKTADFVHPRPAQAVEPHASTSDQWYPPQNHPLAQPTRKSSGGYMEAPAPPRHSRNEINAQFVSSKTIYSPENLQWISLDASQATIVEERRIPAPPILADDPEDRQQLPIFDDARQEAGDPFASVFDRSEVSDTLLSSDDPLRELAPAIPQHNNIEAEATETSQPMLLLGIPVRKLALVLLAGLILLAAIIHRRRTGDLHEMQ